MEEGMCFQYMMRYFAILFPPSLKLICTFESRLYPASVRLSGTARSLASLIGQIRSGVLVLAGEGCDGYLELDVLPREIHQRIDHERVAPGQNRQDQEGVVEDLPIRQPERNVRVSAEDVHVGEGLAEPTDGVEIVLPVLGSSAYRKHQGIEKSVFDRDAVFIHLFAELE